MDKLSLKERLTSWKDYNLFILKFQVIANKAFFAADAALFFVGLLAVYQSLLSLTTLSLFVGIRAVYAAYKLRRTWESLRHASNYEIRKETSIKDGKATIPLTDIQPSDRQAALHFCALALDDDPILRSVSMDDGLAVHKWDWGCMIGKSRRKLISRVISSNREFCLSWLTIGFENARKKNQLFINQKKWCLASELDPTDKIVAVHAGGYFESYCTNEACTASMDDTKGKVLSGYHMFPASQRLNETIFLDDLGTAQVNNHVGISTLAITSDRYLVIWQQGKLNIQDPGKIVATGSGSGDYAEVDLASLRNTVLAGMERELREESLKNGVDLPDKAIAETQILGFFRWIARGGKPEFVGVTRLNVPASALYPDHREVFEIKKLEGMGRMKVANTFHTPNLAALPGTIQNILDLKNKGGKLSLPLKVIIVRMQELLVSNPALLDRALFGRE